MNYRSRLMPLVLSAWFTWSLWCNSRGRGSAAPPWT